jgi:GMP synthase-like glutamine amidotransferase
MALTIRIAILNADNPVPNVLATRGTYGTIFHDLLLAAASRHHSHPVINLEATEFDVVRGEYPSSSADLDALLITGSSSSSYADLPWIKRLDDYLLTVYRDHPHVRIFGSCFGHQIVCQSLLREHGVVVEKDPKGWEIGVHEVRLKDEFCEALGGPNTKAMTPLPAVNRPPTPDTEDPRPAPLFTSPKHQHSLRLQFIHADHVKLPPSGLPPSWIPLGSSRHCPVQGVYQAGRVLTYQGHFEFDRFVNAETLKVFGAKWEPAVLQAGLDQIEGDDDAEIAADIVLRFFLEGRKLAEVEEMGEQAHGGLVTPPLET